MAPASSPVRAELSTSTSTSTSTFPAALTSPSPDLRQAYESYVHASALVLLFACPVLIALPPRKLDIYTFALSTAWVTSANRLMTERTGRGILAYLERERGLNSKTQGTAEAYEGLRYKAEQAPQRVELQTQAQSAVVRQQVESIGEAAKDLWPRREESDWKQERRKEEHKKLENREGYGSMIMDQVWEVWNWGQKKADDIKRKDEKVLGERQEKRS